MAELEAVIGLEVHVQLATATKLFAPVTHAFGREPNTQVDVVTLGLPGSLPVLNERAVELAVRAALALGCEIHPRSKFDRKHYFYPDLPKGYQISQYDEPYCTGGGVTCTVDGGERFVPLTRIHMEEDAGKLVHAGDHSRVDLNRAGTPLVEIVSEPAIGSPAEAHAYLVELKRALKYAGVSYCEMQEGSLRCDANVSIREVGDPALGTKVEIKNLNSFRAVEAALAFEIEQQSALWRAGRYAEVVQGTKLWDDQNGVTRTMREKEGEADYRYFPDPDLPPLAIAPAYVDAIRATMPEAPRARERRFVDELGVAPAVAAELTAEKPVADYFEALLAAGCPAKPAANWTREEALRLAAARALPIVEAAPPARMAALIALVEEGAVARVVAKGACDELFAGDEEPRAFFEARGQIQEQDSDRLATWVAEVIAVEAKAAEDVRGGNLKAIGRLVGATMKNSGGKADPKAVKAEIERQLGAAS